MTYGAHTTHQLRAPPIDVLIVDDDRDTLDSLTAVVEGAGYSVATACNGWQALDQLRAVIPELILLDVVMPDMDGLTFRQEQRHRRDWLRIPTVVMTGTDEETMLDLAVDETLHKPIHADDLLAVVHRHCTHH